MMPIKKSRPNSNGNSGPGTTSHGPSDGRRGKISLAQSYYRMALNNANGELREKVLQAQGELSNTSATAAPERK